MSNTRIYQQNNKTPNFTKEINTEIIKQNTETVMVDNKSLTLFIIITITNVCVYVCAYVCVCICVRAEQYCHFSIMIDTLSNIHDKNIS